LRQEYAQYVHIVNMRMLNLSICILGVCSALLDEYWKKELFAYTESTHKNVWIGGHKHL